ncbi:MAG TPA: hypothetical protein VGQ09_11590 [Chitinophagaceae bacterium]|nr:hypothetical protein [Chitinophagaceae bacterium]
MKTITSYALPHKTIAPFSIFNKFFEWCETQEKNRFGWLAISITAQGCIITLLVIFTVGATGNNLILWIAGMIAMGIMLIVHLAALPTKITIPTFVLSIIIDVVIILACIIQSAVLFSV